MIYFIATADRQFCKIGKAIAPHDRLAALQTACPFKLELLATRAEPDAFERHCHFQFADDRHFGEWFRFSESLLDEFLALKFDPAMTKESKAREHVDMLDGLSIDEFKAGLQAVENPITRMKLMVRLKIAEGESPAGLARKCGLHRNALYGCAHPDWDPKASTMHKIWPFIQFDD